MNPRQKKNLIISAAIAAIFILFIYYHQKLYLPQQRAFALTYYHKWIKSVDETLLSEADFILKSLAYEKEEKKTYTIHGVDVNIQRLPPKDSFGYYFHDTVSFSLHQLMDVVYNGLQLHDPIALITDEQIVWSSWKLTPGTAAKLTSVTGGEFKESQKVLPETVLVDGSEYYIFALTDRINAVKPFQLAGLVKVSDFKQRASTLPIRSISYIATFFLFCLLLIPACKVAIIQQNEEMKVRDYMLVVSSIILLSFLTAAAVSVKIYDVSDKHRLEETLTHSTQRIGGYFENQVLNVLGYMSSVEDRIEDFHYGYFQEGSNDDSLLNITSLYLLNSEGEEVSNWTKRTSISLGKYAHRDYFKAFSREDYSLHYLPDTIKDFTPRKPLLIRCDAASFKSGDKNQNAKKWEIESAPSSFGKGKPFYLQTLSSLIDGNLKNVVSTPASTMEGGVFACSFAMKRMMDIVHPPGYKYAIFDYDGNVYYHSNISEISGNNIYYFFQNTDDFTWKLKHKESFFDEFTIRGKKSYCAIDRMDNLPGFFVMAYYHADLRNDVRGQAWLKVLFLFTLLGLITLLVVVLLKKFHWSLSHWLVIPLILFLLGAASGLIFCQYELKQLEAWTLDECELEKHIAENPFLVFNYAEKLDKAPCKKTMTFFWNHLRIPGTLSPEAAKYRRLLRETDEVKSCGDKIYLNGKMVEVASIFDFRLIPPIIISLLFIVMLSTGMRSYFVIPDRLYRKLSDEKKIPAGEFDKYWAKLEDEKKFLLLDLQDDGVANIKNKDALREFLQNGIVKRDSRTHEPIASADFAEQLFAKLEDEKNNLLRKSRQGNWSKVQLPLYIFIFGCMISVSIFKEGWLNSFVGVITLITTGIGAVGKLLKEFQVIGGSRDAL